MMDDGISPTSQANQCSLSGIAFFSAFFDAVIFESLLLWISWLNMRFLYLNRSTIIKIFITNQKKMHFHGFFVKNKVCFGPFFDVEKSCFYAVLLAKFFFPVD